MNRGFFLLRSLSGEYSLTNRSHNYPNGSGIYPRDYAQFEYYYVCYVYYDFRSRSATCSVGHFVTTCVQNLLKIGSYTYNLVCNQKIGLQYHQLNYIAGHGQTTDQTKIADQV